MKTKFRNEKRAKSGIMRLREFIMKDLYSFHTDQKDLLRNYGLMMMDIGNTWCNEWSTVF